MDLTNYYKILSKIDNKSQISSDFIGILRKEYEFRDSENEGLATVLFYENKPFAIEYFIWRGLSLEFLTNYLRNNLLIPTLSIKNLSEGNGHCSAEILC